MEITEVRIKLMESSEDRLRAFCSITIDQSFVVRDLKIIDGSHGPFVAMPSRKLTGHCNRCGSKNHLRATFCNQCGAKLQSGGTVDAPQKLYADVAHPINSECREMIQNAVVDEFNAELQQSAQPNYRSRYDDEFDAGDYDEADYSDSDSAASVPAVASSVSPSATDSSESSKQGARAASSPADAPDRREKSDGVVLGSFGAGLFDGKPPAGDVEPEVSKEKPIGDDAIVVRGESGVRNRLPRPHFRDRPGGAPRAVVTLPLDALFSRIARRPGGAPRAVVTGDPPSQESRVTNDGNSHQADDASDEETADNSGFGAGIFDG